jgi:hypothetical protein
VEGQLDLRQQKAACQLVIHQEMMLLAIQEEEVLDQPDQHFQLKEEMEVQE